MLVNGHMYYRLTINVREFPTLETAANFLALRNLDAGLQWSHGKFIVKFVSKT